MEVQKVKIKEELHLSGAYIRSLVKQLSSSNPKEAKQPRSSADAAASGGGSSTNLKLGCGSTQKRRERDTQAPRKKQVRRRLHTVKPYQERVLNMAEARREIVAALKQHRASMRRANEDHQQQSRPQEEEEEEEEIRQAPDSSPPPGAAPQNEPISQWNPEVYPSYFAGGSSISSAHCSQFPNLENLSFILPRKPLGLNLSFRGFGREGAAAATHESSCSMSCASCMSSLSSPEVRSTSEAPPPASESTGAPNAQNFHLAMNDEEIAEIKSIGEQYDVEWNDQLNSVTSAWWCNYLQLSEGPPEIQAWSGDQQPLDGYSGKGNMQDTSLPRSDVNGGVESMDYDWHN